MVSEQTRWTLESNSHETKTHLSEELALIHECTIVRSCCSWEVLLSLIFFHFTVHQSRYQCSYDDLSNVTGTLLLICCCVVDVIKAGMAFLKWYFCHYENFFCFPQSFPSAFVLI